MSTTGVNQYFTQKTLPIHYESNLSDSKNKVHALVILGRFLEVAAAGIIIASIVSSFIFTPIALAAIPLGLVLGIVGHKLTKARIYPSGKINIPIFNRPPFIEGQPVGIVNASCNCWINSLMQMVQNVPSLKQMVQNLPSTFQSFKTFSQDYQKAQMQKESTCSGDSQNLRLSLHNSSRGVISDNASRQEDASEALSFIFNHAQQAGSPLFNQVEEVRNGKSFFNPEYLIPVSLFNLKNSSFYELVREYFYVSNGHGNARRYFSNTPQEFMLQMNRYTYDGVSSLKINDPVAIPINFNLPNDWVRSPNGGGTYTCDAFIQHQGSSFNYGHYVAYVRKEDGTWWYCSDNTIYPVSLTEVEQAMQTAYLYHFKRIVS